MLVDLLDFVLLIGDALTSRRLRFWILVLLLCVVALVVIVLMSRK